jgi:hypothetical protein
MTEPQLPELPFIPESNELRIRLIAWGRECYSLGVERAEAVLQQVTAEYRAAQDRSIAAIDKRDDRIATVRRWFDEWELTLPSDVREAFIEALPWAVAAEIRKEPK